MGKISELESAFDAAIAEVQQLGDELRVERAKAVERGAVDTEWFQKTVRRLVEWLPETDLTLIAALGRIVRSTPK